MRKIRNLFTISAAVLCAFTMTSCNGGKTDEIKATNQEIIAQAETLTRDELMKKAAEEIGGGTLKFIGTSSRFKNAIDAFKAELTKYNPDCANMTITQDTAVDGEIYLRLCGEIEAGITNGYDAALVQDGYQLQNLGINTGYFLNYVPKEWNDASDTNKELNAEPFSLQYNMKTWMVNNGDGAEGVVFDNIWDATVAGKTIHTMSPNNENVNRDWLIMLTGDEWCDVLEKAFNDPTNDNKNLNLAPYEQYGEQKYAYAFIEGFLKNAIFYEDDGKARDAFIKDPGSYGWIVYSKIASIQETAEITKKDITIAALGKDASDGATQGDSLVKGFGGFMYKHYLQIMPYTPHPWTSCAFINFLSTTKEGYSAWAVDIGDYPSMPSINVNRTKFGHGTLSADYTWTQNDDGENVFPCLNDPSSSWWEDKANVVIEDPAFIVKEYNNVDSFIRRVIANK
ncbi:MAG: hypothetical protein IAC58_03415 [Firmicutes bacterium]|uniref:ABC transporter substrate-binding protein n=1 Tax=Candidatus Onthovivens merdipullorum TaxID=2840889 RepID=A0A9D9GX76_9BACL|nr:hypothetical protein [Candidatus Onthovivens merdipullorum]